MKCPCEMSLMFPNLFTAMMGRPLSSCQGQSAFLLALQQAQKEQEKKKPSLTRGTMEESHRLLSNSLPSPTQRRNTTSLTIFYHYFHGLLPF